MLEEWKDIKEEGIKDIYEVSNFGRVRNKLTDHILIGDINSVGYRRVLLSTIDCKSKKFLVHRLVAKYFIYTDSLELVVNHMDGNKQNNCVDNLEWCTRSENDLHAYRHNLRKCTNTTPVICNNIEYPSIKSCYRDNENKINVSYARLVDILRENVIYEYKDLKIFYKN